MAPGEPGAPAGEGVGWRRGDALAMLALTSCSRIALRTNSSIVPISSRRPIQARSASAASGAE
jgi:hypothetical protein